MEISDVQKRLNDLNIRCSKRGCIATSAFLTPAEILASSRCFLDAVFDGGYCNAERKIAIFIPDWMDRGDIDVFDYISCIKIQSFFGEPSHRDYMGAVLGLGIARDRIGDIIVTGNSAYLFCLKSVERAIVESLENVGHISVRLSIVPHSDIPDFKKEVKSLSFTVRSARLDAIVSDMFRISRSSAAEAIKEGIVFLNYSICEKCDAEVKVNDVISVRGKGKGRITEIGGKSKRDRIFVTADIFV